MFPEEISLSDNEAKDSENESDDCEPTAAASECRNDEPDGAADSTTTLQVNEMAESASSVSSTVKESATPFEGKANPSSK